MASNCQLSIHKVTNNVAYMALEFIACRLSPVHPFDVYTYNIHLRTHTLTHTCILACHGDTTRGICTLYVWKPAYPLPANSQRLNNEICCYGNGYNLGHTFIQFKSNLSEHIIATVATTLGWRVELQSTTALLWVEKKGGIADCLLPPNGVVDSTYLCSWIRMKIACRV